MTEKLYYSDSYIKNFTAEIIDIIELKDDITAIVLDRTAFFPEGGGQQGDSGTIADISIYDTQIHDNIIYHYSKDEVKLKIGDSVFCCIDWKKRYIRMQSHTGEHILSGLAKSLFSADNVGFHMDENYNMTVDFNLPLTKAQINRLELIANEYIQMNLPVMCDLYSDKETTKMEYRSKKDIAGTVRIVSIGDIDKCACCAPHVNYTGCVGMLKILQSMSHRGGVRLTVICASTAFDDYIMKHNSTLSISALLCTPHNNTASSVEALITQNKELKKQISDNKSMLFQYISDSIADFNPIISFFSEFTMNDLIRLTEIINKNHNSSIFLFSGNDNDGYIFSFFSDIISMSDFMKNFRNVFRASGGGRGNSVQGKVSSSKTELTDYLRKEAKY